MTATPSTSAAVSRSTAAEDLLTLPSFDTQANLRQQVGDALRALLITGAMRPGQVYSAPKLAGRFGVSATPVREAMLDLVSEGLVTVVRNKGFRVTEVDDKELDSIAELRGLIEVPIMGMVAQECDAATAIEVERLRPLAKQITKAAAEGDLLTYTEVDKIRTRKKVGAGNSRVVSVVHDLRLRSRLFGLEALAAAGVLAQMSHEHEEMVDAALRRDGDGMREVMGRHMGHIRSTWAGRSS